MEIFLSKFSHLVTIRFAEAFASLLVSSFAEAFASTFASFFVFSAGRFGDRWNEVIKKASVLKWCWGWFLKEFLSMFSRHPS